MTIDRLGPVDPVSKFNQASKTAKSAAPKEGDSVEVSSKARSMGEIYKATEAAKVSPEVREDRVAEVKKKLEDPSYIDNKVVDSVADSVMDLFGLG